MRRFTRYVSLFFAKLQIQEFLSLIVTSPFQAWSQIVYYLMPNIQTLESQLANFCEICEADEVVLFERTTFLVIAKAGNLEHQDKHRFEKISNIIKQFKLGCR